MHGRALQREAQLKVENERLQALLRLREQQLFGRKTETSAATAPAASDAPHADSPPRRPRGQQRGGPSPKRRDYSHLPAVVEDKVLPPDQCHCSRCGQPFADFPGTEDSTILEIDVRAHRRVIRRRRYRPTCSCGAHPGIVTAPPPDRLIPKSMLGISILVTVLLDKYLLNETLRWTRSTLAPFALVRLFSLVPHLLPVVPIIPVVTICARAFPVACLSRRFDHAILLAFHGNLYHDSAPTALH